jgi:DNA processing protein
MQSFTMAPADILGALNNVERKFAPPLLYLAGDRAVLRVGPKVSIVGSRNASPAGLKRAAKLARLLANRGALVVSGLAEGIDTAAHRAAIESGGRTMSVLGSSLDNIYPASNRELFGIIAQHHLAVSQFASGHPTTRKNFVLRNRTMALLSDATVIVEAGESSGTVHQGWEAIRLGRPLYLLESLAEAGLKWPAQMIGYGAQVLAESNTAAVLDDLPSAVLADAVAF